MTQQLSLREAVEFAVIVGQITIDVHMAAHGWFVVVVAVDLPHVIGAGTCVGKDNGCTGFDEIHVVIDGIMNLSVTSKRALPCIYVSSCHSHHTKLAINKGACREAVARGEILLEENCAIRLFDNDVIIDTYLWLAVCLALRLANTNLAILEVAAASIHQHIVDIRACTRGVGYFDAKGELVLIVQGDLSCKVDIGQTRSIATTPLMRTQARIAPFSIELPEVEIAFVLHAKTNACSRVLDTHLSLYGIILDFLRLLAILQIGGFYPDGRREGILG